MKTFTEFLSKKKVSFDDMIYNISKASDPIVTVSKKNKNIPEGDYYVKNFDPDGGYEPTATLVSVDSGESFKNLKLGNIDFKSFAIK